MADYWVRETQSLNPDGEPNNGTATYEIMKGQGPTAVVVDKGNSKDWALKRASDANLHGSYQQLQEDFDEVLATMESLARYLNGTLEHMTYEPSKKTAEDLIRRSQRLVNQHKKAGNS